MTADPLPEERWPHEIRAVIFDLDGVLVDSEPVHHAATARLVAPEVVTDEEYAQFVGTSIEVFATWLRDRFDIDASDDEVMARYDALVLEAIIEMRPPPLDGVIELIDAIRERELPIAVASQSRPGWVNATLEGAGLTAHIDLVVAADAVVRGKPDPDIYLYTADLLAVAPEACLVFEDSVPGVQSAHSAGMLVVQSQQASSAVARQPGAHHLIAAMRDADLGWLEPAG